jgi:hypothetical protein
LTETGGLSTLAFRNFDRKAELSVMNLREMPKDLIAKVKAAAALEHAPLKKYVTRILNHHVTEREKKGLLPKGK